MTQTAQIVEFEPAGELTPDERQARFATTAAAVAGAHDGHLLRSLASARWERRGLLQRLVKVSS
jgi:hypothetical protein